MTPRFPRDASLVQHLAKDSAQRLVVDRQVEHAQAQSLGELARIAHRPMRPEEQHSASRHERRPDELVRACLGVIAVHEHEAGAHAAQRGSRRLVREWETRRVPREFGRGAKECGGQWIVGEHEDSVATHGVIGVGSCGTAWG
jgi:hypothetical protein